MKAAIERAALELFVERGVDGTTVRDLAHRAGVTEGALYRYHASRDELVKALFLQHYAGFAARLTEAQAGASDAPDRIRAMVGGFFEFYDADPAVFQYVLMTRHAILDEVRSGGPDNPVDVIHGVIDEGIRAGAWPDQDVSLAAELCIGMVMEVAVGRRYGRLAGALAPLAGEVTSAVLAVLRRHASPPVGVG